MRRTLLILSVALSVLAGARGQQPAGSDSGGDKKVDFDSRSMRSVPGMPDSVMRLVGDVVLYHNGAVVTCDSAYRYGDKHFECFGRVLINKDSTYIYGDRAVYDGHVNTAQVFAPLVKVVDGNTTLYTYNFSFNTLDNIGTYWGGGTINQEDNMLESERGYYYSDTHEVVCVDNVSATNPEYKMASDSVRYNMDTEMAEFYTPTTIWNDKGEILFATRGKYYHQTAHYEFTRDTYMLTETQEVWCDSLDYDSRVEDAVLRWNIQIRDEEQKVMAFGDYGQYWGEREEALLTRNPSLVTFDPEQDSLYLRSDSMFVYSIAYELDYKEYDSLRRVQNLLTLSEEQAILDAGEGTAAVAMPEGTALPGPGSVPGTPQEQAREERREREDTWIEGGDTATRDKLRRMVADEKRILYEAGDTLTRVMLTPHVSDSLLRAGVSSEDIKGQLLYNERKRALEEQGLPVSDSLIYEVLESIGAFGNPVPEPDAEALIDSLRKETVAGPVSDQGETVATEGTEAGEDIVQEGAQEEEKAVVEEQKLSRRERRKLEREREAAEKKEKQAAARKQAASVKDNREMAADSAGRAVAEGLADSAGMAVPPEFTEDVVPDSLGRSVLGELAEGIAIDSLGRPVIADSLLRDAAGMVMSDSLRNKLQEMGVDPDTFQQGGDAGSAVVVPDSLQLPDSLSAGAPVENDSLQRVIFAYHNVRIYRVDMQAVCDSMVAFSKDSTAHLYIDPVLWNKQNQITAEVIDIYTRNQQIERAFFTGGPLMISEVDSTQYNQIKGREMESFFRDNEIFWHSVKGNAQTLYYMMDDEAGEANGFLVVNSASIGFLMEDQGIVRMTWHQDPDAVAYPIDKVPLDVPRFLDGFRWEIARRPELKDVFDRTIRSSERVRYESLPQPEFFLTRRIGEERVKLVESRLWEDRVDTLSPHALQVLREMGVAGY